MEKIYLCGPTVYSTPHIGNMRPIISFDIHIRSLKYLGKKTLFIHNITDIDDKIISASKLASTTEKELSSKYKDIYLNLLKEYNVMTPDHMPTVTNNMSDIINFIQRLIEKEFAYESDGDVYFDVTKSKTYGKLSNRDIKNLRDSKISAKKNNPADFTLWKKTIDGINFKSPWSKGRPGWHTECVTFIDKILLGDSLDIHGGGIDLLFPHHENERIQFYAMHKKEITKEWKHIGKLEFNGEKMSKSIGNVINATDFLREYNADTLRWIFFTTNPTTPLKLNKELLESAGAFLDQIRKDLFIAKQKYKENLKQNSDIKEMAIFIENWEFSKSWQKLNFLIKKYRNEKNVENSTNLVDALNLIGFNISSESIDKHLISLYKQWEIFRENKNFKDADLARKKLIKYGLI